MKHPPTDAMADLLARARAGDRDAFAELMRRYFDAVYRQIVLYVGRDAASADDVAQETWLRVSRGIRGFRGDAGFYTWVCRVAKNESTRRGRRRRPTLVAELPEVAQDDRGRVDQADRAELVRMVLRRLPEKFRQPLVLELWEDMPLRAIAEALGLPEGTVKSRLSRARQKFRELWHEVAGE